MIIAEIDSTGWSIIIANTCAALTLAIAQILKMIFDHRREMMKAVKVEEAKQNLCVKLANVAEKVEEVHKTANSMSVQLQEAKFKEGFEQGRSEMKGKKS